MADRILTLWWNIKLFHAESESEGQIINNISAEIAPNYFGRPIKILELGGLGVAYFVQRLGAVHSEGWLKYAFSKFFMQKSWKEEEKARKLTQYQATNLFFEIAAERWSSALI